MRLIDADALYERACELEAQALEHVGKIANDETKIEEWRIWSAILAERTAFKHDIFDAPEVKPEMKWIPCSERLPEEKDSIFAKFYGTDKWRSSMMRKRSKKVIVTVEYSDGERQTDVASTNDGRWADSLSVVKKKVIAWMPLPEPYKGDT